MNGPQEGLNLLPSPELIRLGIPEPCRPGQYKRPECPYWVLLCWNTPLPHVTNHVHGYRTNHHPRMVFQSHPFPNPMGTSRRNFKRNQCPTQHSYQPFTSTPSRTKDPNAMDVDVVHIGKLTPEERKQCIEKGLCFHCWKPGHLSRECPSFPNKKPGRQVKRIIREEELPNLQEVDDDEEETVRRISFTPMDF